MNRKQKTKHIFSLLNREQISEKSKLQIIRSRMTPYVLLDPQKEILVLKGRSSPEYSLKFYELVYAAIENYRLTGRKRLQAHIHLHYFNTSTAKCLFDLMKKLNKIHQEGLNVSLKWYYEPDDEDMLEAGEDFNEISAIDFKFIPLAG